LRGEGLDVDFLSAQVCAEEKPTATGNLARAASFFRGPLLADLELPENSDFHTWLLGMREDARQLQAKVLGSLIERLSASPEQADRNKADRPRAWRTLCAGGRGPAVGESGPRDGTADRCRSGCASLGGALHRRRRGSVCPARRDYEPDCSSARSRIDRGRGCA